MPSKASGAKAKIEGLASSVSATGSTDGLSLGQKFFFIVVIVAACGLFLNSRKGGLKEKSMA
jgi:peptidyl-prolyl cis-trans isomerase B (cyclophilin B)